MTTIATDGKSMAGDGMISCDGTVFDRNFVKVHRLRDGRIAGVCGSAYDIEPFCMWLEEGGDKPKLSDGFEALVLDLQGGCRSYNSDCQSLREPTITASGGGKDFALAAMDAGASPERAVEIACDRALGTGGKITVLHIEPPLRAVA
jgi:ATP-dependent protease HslVU (ClpYQ) peptidase subunit